MAAIKGELISLKPPAERAILVSAPLKRSAAKLHADEYVEELARLADTAGAEVVGYVTQQLDRPHAATYLGSGKVDELKERIQELEATLVIFDDELSPAQSKNVEELIGTRLMDRAELILDIFATRARSNEARVQVELAQLEYMLPRLKRMWTHLDTMKGGIGMRGPGETQLETDRRLIQARVRMLKERLADVERARTQQRQGRDSHFRVALVGYTNAGKSSILRALSHDREVFVEDRLFATLDPLTREIDLGEGYNTLLTDTVGFIRKLPHHLVASFRATLAEAREADLLLHVIDASHPTWEAQRDVVHEVLADLGLAAKPQLHVMNKMDALPLPQRDALRDRVTTIMPDSVFVSALEPGGLTALQEHIRTMMRSARPLYEIRIPVGNGKMLSDVHRDGEVLEQANEGDTMIVRVRLDERAIGKLRHDGARIMVVPRDARPLVAMHDADVTLVPDAAVGAEE